MDFWNLSRSIILSVVATPLPAIRVDREILILPQSNVF
jgi:hypothetical protein